MVVLQVQIRHVPVPCCFIILVLHGDPGAFFFLFSFLLSAIASLSPSAFFLLRFGSGGQGAGEAARVFLFVRCKMGTDEPFFLHGVFVFVLSDRETEKKTRHENHFISVGPQEGP
jgi:hypothetical protein